MSTVAITDPRSFVKLVPLPIPSHRGIAIQARNSIVYNATVPARDEIRRENYQRRNRQQTSQGFRTNIKEPYQPIGSPIYYSENYQQLILESLGQLDVGCSNDTPSSDESSDNQHQRNRRASVRPQTAPVAQKTLVGDEKRKRVSDLQKEVDHGGELIKQVRKGHSIFKLMQKEQQEKIESQQRELLRKQELKRTQMQSPKFNSDSEQDELDDEDAETWQQQPSDGEYESGIAEDFILDGDTEMSGLGGVRPFSTGVMEGRRVAFITDQPGTLRMRSSTKNSSRVGSSKHPGIQRPYTPQHSNIAASELNAAPDKSSLFRQLCILYWLLDTMNADPQRIVRPIASCWTAKDLLETDAERNRRKNTERTMHEKQELLWKQFISGTSDKKKRYSPTRVRGYLHQRTRRDNAFLDANRHRDLSARRDSVSWHDIAKRRDSIMSTSRSDSASRLDGQRPPDASSTYSDSQSSIGQFVEDSSSKDDAESVSARVPDLLAAQIDGDADKDVMEREDDTKSSSAAGKETTTGISLFTVAIPATVAASVAMRRRSSSLHGTASVSSKITADEAKPTSGTMSQADIRKLTRREKILNKINRLDAEARWQKPRDELANFRASAVIKPKKTPLVEEYESTAASNCYRNMPQTMRNKFQEIVKEKEHMLNDRLEAMHRERFEKMKTKFAHKATEACVDVALHAMRQRHLEQIKARKKDIKKDKKNEIYHKWFTDLQRAIPDDVKDSWNCKKVMDKLEKYGLVEAGKQSAIKMQRVLAGLRSWEICAPDVSAAVEFCRQRIVEMPVEEYEKWFSETFPNITRPPFVSVTDSKKLDTGANSSHVVTFSSRRFAKSAPPRFRLTRT